MLLPKIKQDTSAISREFFQEHQLQSPMNFFYGWKWCLDRFIISSRDHIVRSKRGEEINQHEMDLFYYHLGTSCSVLLTGLCIRQLPGAKLLARGDMTHAFYQVEYNRLR